MALFAPGSVVGTLRQIVALAEHTVEGCDAAGVLVVDDDVASTVAAGNTVVVALDDVQRVSAEGPGLDAALSGSTVYAEDLLDDPRWLTFGPAAVANGVRSVLAYSLSDKRLSALSFYAQLPAAFGATDRAQGQLFATLARLALESAEARALDEGRTENLTRALQTRELIGQAQGILMERERITADQAFDVLRKASQRMNVKLREVAEGLVESGESPEPSGPRPDV